MTRDGHLADIEKKLQDKATRGPLSYKNDVGYLLTELRVADAAYVELADRCCC